MRNATDTGCDSHHRFTVQLVTVTRHERVAIDINRGLDHRRKIQRLSRRICAVAPDRLALASVLTPNKSEHLVALRSSISASERAFEVQAQQRLGVRRTHVEMPVVGYDRQPVEVRHRALRAEHLFSSRSFEGTSATGVLISPVMK